MKKACLLLCFFSHWVHAQKTTYDSLAQQLAAEKNGTVQLRLLTSLVNKAFYENLNTALAYARQGVVLAEKMNDKDQLPVFYEMEGHMHSYLLHFDAAKNSLQKAIDGYGAVNNKKSQANALFKLAWVLKRTGQKEKGMEADLGALRLMEQLNDVQGIAQAYEHISDGLTRQGRKAEAMDYARKSIDLNERNNFMPGLVYAWFNLGNVYIAMDSNQQSLLFYNKAVESGRLAGLDPVSLIHSIVGRGNALKRLKRYKDALTDYNYALTAAKKINYVNAITVAIANLGEVNMLLGNYRDALNYQLETVSMQERDSSLFNLTENYGHVSTIYEKLGDYQQALVYQKKALAMRNRVASFESDTAMSRLLTQYQAEKNEATIAAQQNEILQQKKVQWLSIGVAVLMAGLLTLGYRSLRTRNRSNKLLAAKNAENELLLKEIHHRVKNNLQVVSGLLELQSAQIDDPGTRAAIQDGQNRVHSIGIVHQKLYQGKSLGAVEMKDYFFNLSESILDSFNAENSVSIELDMENLDVDIDTAVPLGLIVNELLTNAIKYAFPGRRHGSVRISLQKKASGTLHLEVSDNGIGKSGIIHGTGFGGQLVSLLTRQLNGSLRESNTNGTSFSFVFRV